MQLLLRLEVGKCRDCGEPIYWDEKSIEPEAGEYVCASCADDYARCCDCGEWKPKYDLNETHDGAFVCESCRYDRWRLCKDCGKLYREDDMTYVDSVDEFVCEDCRDANYGKCDDCDEWFRNDEFYLIGNSQFCSSCESDWTECEDCGNAVRNDESYYIVNGRTICQSCYENDYFTCERCGEIFHNDEYYNGYCESCSGSHLDSDGVYSYHAFKDNGDWTPRVARGEISTGALFFGIELECENGEFDVSDFSTWTDCDDLIHFEHDGSLDDGGVELITQPCTLRFHQENMNWDGIVGKLAAQGFRSHNAANCGFHVHLSRRALKPTIISKLDVFLNRGADFFEQIARREIFYRTQYDRLRKMSKAKGTRIDDSNNRYTAVNTSNCNTVEIRIFKGTLKTETILGTLEMLDALVKFLDLVPFGHLYETDANVVKFVDYCIGHTDIYPHVLPMMRRLVRHGVAKPNIDNYFVRLAQKQTNQQKGENQCA